MNTLENIMDNNCFKDTVLKVYDEFGECGIDMTFDEIPGMIVSLYIQDERNIEEDEND